MLPPVGVSKPAPVAKRPVPQVDPGPLPPLVVIEAGPGLPDFSLLAEIVERRGGGLVVVDSVEEIFHDQDYESVHTIVMAKPRSMADWPEAYATTKKRAADRVVFAVVALPPSGAVTQALSRDRFVLTPPVTPDVWMRSLEDHGWCVKS